MESKGLQLQNTKVYGGKCSVYIKKSMEVVQTNHKPAARGVVPSPNYGGKCSVYIFIRMCLQG